MRKNGKGKTVEAVIRAFSLLELLAKHNSPLSISELAKKADLNISTTHRLLNTMLNKGFIEQETATLHYRLGYKVFEIGNAVLAVNDLKTAARPFLKQLVERVNETANLAILDDTEVVYIDQVESSNMIIVKMFARMGSRGPAYCTGTGKVQLAYLEEDELRRRMSRMEFIKYTESTITDFNKLITALAKIRRDGYALDFSERDEGVVCMAAPIINYENRVIAAVSVSGPAHRMSMERINQEILPAVLTAAQAISEKIGFRGVLVNLDMRHENLSIRL